MIEILIPVIIVGLTVALAWPLGRWMKWAMDVERPGPIRLGYEGLMKRLLGRLVDHAQGWRAYSVSLLVFNALMFAFTYGVLWLQPGLPFNPDAKGPIEPDLVFHTIASFTANTNLQHYSGEVAMSFASQIFALTWLQFVSAAVGIAALTALCRGLAGRGEIGNFFTDLHRATFLVLLPLALLLAPALILLGMPMTLEGAAVARTLEGAAQTIARGPVAAMVAIKQLGTNGGGYFGPNSTHPFENPGFWTNAFENVAVLLIPMASVWMFGRIVGRLKHAAVLFSVMLALYAVFVTSAVVLESAPTVAFQDLPVAADRNLEGKELRFGPTAGPFWAVSTTVTSNGSVDAMHDSLNPLTGLFPMIGMWLNVIFGGVGVGFINMFLFIVVAVFIAGMMVGRTPEYLAKKVEAGEMKLALIALLAHPLFILGGTAWFASTSWGMDTILNTGSHGLSEILYEFSSAAANNGSGFEGLGDNTLPWNIATGTVMLLARFIPILAPLAIAGSLAAKRPTPETAGSLRTDGLMFGVILLATVVLVGALLFMPVAVLGPIAEHLAYR